MIFKLFFVLKKVYKQFEKSLKKVCRQFINSLKSLVFLDCIMYKKDLKCV